MEFGTTGATPLSATVTKATLTYDDGVSTFLQEIVVDPDKVDVPAGSLTAYGHRKVGAMDDLPRDCDGCGDDVTLDVELTVDGVWTVSRSSGPITMDCVY